MKGVYLIKLELKNEITNPVGKLGLIFFKKGFYYYCGSAQNNLEKRIERHKRKEKKIHWHIDYLTTNNYFKFLEYEIFKDCIKEKECQLAENLKKKCEPIKKFGCTDCKCISHLFYYKNLLKDNCLN